MIDERIHTFLRLCQLRNYRQTAQALHMTQPAVTQHIQYLEKAYGCKLFTYDRRVLSQTAEGAALEEYARSLVYNDSQFRARLGQRSAVPMTVGTTKSIGDYVAAPQLIRLMEREDVDLTVIIDNTEHLLSMLRSFQLDILLVEGFVDKNLYAHRLIRREELVGICAPDHPFAGREVPLEALFSQHILLREHGSGTRAVFEAFLQAHGYSSDSFRRRSQISSFPLITQAVAHGCGISFVYDAVHRSSPEAAAFRIAGCPIWHEFNYVYLKNTDVGRYLELLDI